nr:AT-rich interactive domain-containing protein 4A-like [Anolis sagrei ordinatus]
MMCEEEEYNSKSPDQKAMCFAIQQDGDENPESSTTVAELIKKTGGVREIQQEQRAEEQPYRFIAEDGVPNIKSEVYSQKRPCKRGTSPAAEPIPVADYLRASEESIETIGLERQVINSEEKEESLTLKDVFPSAPRKEITSAELFDKDNKIKLKEKAEEKQTLDLTVETDESSKYPRTLCETKIHTPEGLIEVKMTSRHDSSTIKVPDDHTKEVLKIGTIAEDKSLSKTYQRAGINKMINTRLYPMTDDGEKERHFAESKTLDQLFLTNSEHVDMPTSEERVSRKRRFGHVSEERSPLSLNGEEGESGGRADRLTRKLIYTDYIGGDKKKKLQFLDLKVCPDSSDELAMKKDNIRVHSSKDSEFSSVPRKDVRGIPDTSLKSDATLKQAVVQALKLDGNRTVPDNWKVRLKEETPAAKKRAEKTCRRHVRKKTVSPGHRKDIQRRQKKKPKKKKRRSGRKKLKDHHKETLLWTVGPVQPRLCLSHRTLDTKTSMSMIKCGNLTIVWAINKLEPYVWRKVVV